MMANVNVHSDEIRTTSGGGYNPMILIISFLELFSSNVWLWPARLILSLSSYVNFMDKFSTVMLSKMGPKDFYGMMEEIF